VIILHYALFSRTPSRDVIKEYVTLTNTIVSISVTSKLFITRLPVSKPSNTYSSNWNPGINSLTRYDNPKQSRADITNLVKKFCLIVKKLNSADERNIAIVYRKKVARIYIRLLGSTIPLNIVNTKYATNIYCINLLKNFFIFISSYTNILAYYINI
jgi:hypothetical protein